MDKNLSRIALVAGCGAMALPALAAKAGAAKNAAAAGGNPAKPNVIIVITDQQFRDKLSFTGNKALSTPNFDRLARSGYSFNNAFCAFPLSVPSRFDVFGTLPGGLRRQGK